MEELQLRLLEKQLTTKFFLFWGKKAIFSKKWRYHQKKVIALNMYIGTNVLMYERWLVLKVRYTAGPTLLPFHRLTLLVHMNQISRFRSFISLCLKTSMLSSFLMFISRPFQKADTLNLKDFSPSFRLVFGTFNILLLLLLRMFLP